MLSLLLARRRLEPPDFEASALWGAYECARCGITSIADTAYDGVAVARAAGAAGLRARVYQEVFGLDDAALPGAMDQPEDGGRPAPARVRRPSLEAGVSPHAPYTVSARLYREAARLRAPCRAADRHCTSPNPRPRSRCSTEGRGAIARAYRRAGLWGAGTWTPPRVRPLEYVAGTGALSPDALVIHAVQAEGREIDLLAASGAAVAHCPRSNARLRCGVAPVAEMLAAGVSGGTGHRQSGLQRRRSTCSPRCGRRSARPTRSRAASGAVVGRSGRCRRPGAAVL